MSATIFAPRAVFVASKNLGIAMPANIPSYFMQKILRFAHDLSYLDKIFCAGSQNKFRAQA